jgi:hypothetical protein
MSKYNKAIAACAAAAIQIIILVLPQTQGVLRTTLILLMALLTPLVVYAVPNRPALGSGAQVPHG